MKKHPAKFIPHNLPVVARKRRWVLVFSLPNTNAIFQSGSGSRRVIRGSNQGWSYDDVQSFARYLAGLEGTHP